MPIFKKLAQKTICHTQITRLIRLSLLISSSVLAQEGKEFSTQAENPHSLVSYGSDTLANLMDYWGQSYTKRYPNIQFELHSEGSSTAANGLIHQTASLGPMSRLMTPKEMSDFKLKHGYQPTPIKVAMDAIAIFVNRDNPLSSISVQQLDAIFSNDRICGYESNISYWHELGLTNNWNNKKIELIGRNKVSGTHAFFRQQALCNGQFKSRVLEQPGSTSLVQVISHSVYAIGFSGLGFKTAGVKALAVVNNDSKIIEASSHTVREQTYPLARFLYIYINQSPHKKLPNKVSNFLNIALSEQGQAIVERDGYVALSKKTRTNELKKLQP